MAGGSGASGDAPDTGLRILGTISIEVGGAARPVGGQKPRRLLSMLAIHRNSVVSTDMLIKVIWDDAAPDGAVAALQTYVSRLRRVLPPSIRLTSQSPGYRLVVDSGAVDVDRFEVALAAGTSVPHLEPRQALAQIDAALSEWRGDAFAEFTDEWWARAEVVRLSELRMQAREARLSALMMLGLDEEIVADASAITLDHPRREKPWIALVGALHRAGRQGDALLAANQYRTWLGEDLGLDPSPEFERAERDVAAGASVADRSDEQSTRRGVQLVGRDDDAERVVVLAGQRRLVTLIGPGGIGKTQLALSAAAHLTARTGLRHEVVELGPVRDEQSVVAAIATQLHVQPQHGRSVEESVLDVLGDRPLLLVLDNCEHVLETVGRFVERLLRVCPRVRVLATSREPLALHAEAVFVVPALAAADVADDIAVQLASPAVALFVERARAANPDFIVDDQSTRAVGELCRRLDGVPLAIELAAARARSLSPSEIIERLADRFVLLSRSSRGSDPRHRSLKDLVDWSYDLLERDAQLLFRRLSIFAGQFDLDAAEQVCGYGDVPTATVAALLGSLVDKSMVQARTGQRTTYRLLETLRAYGAGLEASGEAELRRRHGAWITAICGCAARGMHGSDERHWLDLLDGYFDDLRLAVRNALQADDLTTALGIVVFAREHAFRRMRYELIGWAEIALAHEGASSHPLGAAALGIVAYGRFTRGEIDAAIELGQRSIELALDHGSDGLGLAERALGNACVFRGDVPRSIAALDHLVDGAVASGDDARIAHAYYMRSLAETRIRHEGSGTAYAQRAVEAGGRSGNPTAQAQAMYASGLWLVVTDPARSREHLLRSEQLARQVGNDWFELFARTETLWLTALDGRPADTLSGFADVIAAWHRAGDWANQWLSLRHVLGICHLVGADELAVVIHGALERAGAVDAFPVEPSAARRLEATAIELPARLGTERFAAARLFGQVTATPALIEHIVAELRVATVALRSPRSR